LYGVPLALWIHIANRRLRKAPLFCATMAFWALCMELGDAVGFPSKCEALSALAFAPVLLGGCRLFGANLACGILMAGAVCCGVALSRSTWQRALLPLGVSWALLLGASALAHESASPPISSLSVGVPQLNVPSAYFKRRQALPAQTELLEDLISKQIGELRDVELLAFTETYDGTFPVLVPKLRQRFLNHAKLTQQAILLPSYLVGARGGGLNAVAAIDATGKLVGVHRKVDLAPFGEVELERGAGFRAFAVLKTAKVGVLICQEALLPSGPRALVRDGANVLVTSTSDVSFGSGILSFGHLAAARLRAIEVGRAMVWASNGGPSGSITRWGEFRPAAPFRRASAAAMRLESFADRSIYLSSSWIWPALCGALLLFTLCQRSRSEPCVKRALKPSTLRGLLELSLALALLAIATFGSPFAVELMSGSSSRGSRAVLELIGRAEPELGTDSLARFHSDEQHSAQGALAFYLDYYGDHRLPSSIALSGAELRLSDLSRELTETEGFPTREVRLDFSALPRASALVRLKSGQFGVLTANSLGVVGLFLPTADGQTVLTTQQAEALLEPSALLPAEDSSF
jgi:apolipoprotein N-acyltransferase